MNRQSSSHHGARVSAHPVRPPHERGTWKAFALAALMHVLLGSLLYHGVNWQNNTPAGAEAELWTEIPDQATPTPRPVPPPAPPAKDEEADIALQEKKRKQQEAAARAAQLAEQQRAQQLAAQEAEAKRQQQLAAQQTAQQAALAAQKAAQDKQKQADKQKQLAQQKLDQQKAQQVKEKEAATAKAVEQQKEAEAKAQEQADAKAKAQADAQAKKAKLDKERSARLAALQGQAGGGTSESGEGLAKSGTGRGAGGTATSAGYAEKVQRRVRPNIRWGGETAGLETVISVRVSPATGTLLSASIQRSSGNDQWDQAALRAVQLSDPMPLDINGQAPPTFTITMRPAGG
ncbi:MAG: TolA protein [uncultured Caballeronia sp.]|nr:MAG: TolA protein [uncultured Caballeronia sp.]